jgi:hypothetical protein
MVSTVEIREVSNADRYARGARGRMGEAAPAHVTGGTLRCPTCTPEAGRRHFPLTFTTEAVATAYLVGVAHSDPDARLVNLRRLGDGWAACLSSAHPIDGDPGFLVPGAALGGACGCGT